MNRREFLGLAAAAPLVAPAVVEQLAAPKQFNVEAVKAATKTLLKPMAAEIYSASFLETWTPTGDKWIYRQRMGETLIRSEVVDRLPFVIMCDNEPQPLKGLWFSSRKYTLQFPERDAG